MIRPTILAVAMFLFVLSGFPATAEIYKYRDEQGVTRYTYDLGEVPEDQRPGIQTYEEAASSAVESPAAVPEAEVPADKAEDEPTGDGSPVVDDKKIEELNQKKKELDQEFAELMEEKYKLVKEKKRLDTLAGRDAAAVAAYDSRVRELNRKIADYQKRQEAFQKEAEAVKKAVEESNNAADQ